MDSYNERQYAGGSSSVSHREIIDHFNEFRRAIHEGPVSLVQNFYHNK